MYVMPGKLKLPPQRRKPQPPRPKPGPPYVLDYSGPWLGQAQPVCGDITAGGGTRLIDCIRAGKSLSSYLGQACGDITARGGTRLVDCLVARGKNGLGDIAPLDTAKFLQLVKAQQKLPPAIQTIINAPPALPYATPETIRAAAALPNAPAIVKQTAASLPQGTWDSITGWFSTEAIAGTGVSYGLLAGAGTLLALIAIMKAKR